MLKSVNTAPSPGIRTVQERLGSAVRLGRPLSLQEHPCCSGTRSSPHPKQGPGTHWMPPPPRVHEPGRKEQFQETRGQRADQAMSAGPGRSASTQAASSMEPPPPWSRRLPLSKGCGQLPGPSAHQ